MRAQALRLLARREHSERELSRRLNRSFDATSVAGVLTDLATRGLQSDDRFAESFVRERVRRGQGPLRIRADLQQRGTPEDVIDRHLTRSASFWLAQAREVRRRRFGEAIAVDRTERARQLRFLLQRGFPGDLLTDALARNGEPD